MDLLSRFI